MSNDDYKITVKSKVLDFGLSLIYLSFLHSCVERHLEEQGNLFRAPYFMSISSGIKHKKAK